MTHYANSLPDLDRQGFTEFYDVYAPKLWGIILSVDLSTSQSETILIDTFTKVWQRFSQQTSPEKPNLTWLLSLAYSAGLPMENVREALLLKK